MELDPYRISAPLYDTSVGRLSVFLDRPRMILAPPIQGMNVLDVGCGTGSDLKLYHQAGCNVHGVDLSPSMLNVARRKLGDSADLRLCNAMELPFNDEFFDLVTATYTLHEMKYEHRPMVIREMIRVLKRDGHLLLIDFLPGPYSIPTGWIIRSFILTLEIMAGREHLSNGRDFLSRGGLLGLVKGSSLKIKKTFSIGAGNIGFFLLHTY
jgi:ubiquinone/menaquinone biosynthesis C-methylase UbiE